ncbi:MAG TPA: zf-HC2 domain-containing protein [Candidatus Acidoferrum sp.]|nr:zf-HC2 domain-containing protein [Candidatus Acidoferrum sp.]
MNCQSATREISNYIDGDMDAGLRHDLEVHLHGCQHCTVVLNQVKMTVELFCDEEPVELPGDVRSRLYDALQKKLGAK